MTTRFSATAAAGSNWRRPSSIQHNPLTARVIVNRVWMHHFGFGLVRTPSDFGFRGDPPTHPELLDYLAVKFVESGWSLKKLHRLIMTSAAYRQASADNEAARKIDPENQLLWRMNRRRLEIESLRDSMLAAAGRLDSRPEAFRFSLRRSRPSRGGRYTDSSSAAASRRC